MFDKYLILNDSLVAFQEGEQAEVRFKARLGYYRGLGLSMVEDLEIEIDGEKVDRNSIRFNEGPGWLRLDEMETAYDRRWGFGQVAEIAVDLADRLAPGSHDVSLIERLRVSYLPFPAINSDRKTLHLRDDAGTSR